MGAIKIFLRLTLHPYIDIQNVPAKNSVESWKAPLPFRTTGTGISNHEHLATIPSKASSSLYVPFGLCEYCSDRAPHHLYSIPLSLLSRLNKYLLILGPIRESDCRDAVNDNTNGHLGYY